MASQQLPLLLLSLSLLLVASHSIATSAGADAMNFKCKNAGNCQNFEDCSHACAALALNPKQAFCANNRCCCITSSGKEEKFKCRGGGTCYNYKDCSDICTKLGLDPYKVLCENNTCCCLS